FYLLYDKICREDILCHAYALARANAGAPGRDGMTFAQIEASANGLKVSLKPGQPARHAAPRVGLALTRRTIVHDVDAALASG
ncbi:MAG: hypothetical protein WAL02_16935, partial [Rhodoplanes sp.]